jgi:L-asparaginase / beta-aspartyl-peptidase
MTDLHSHVQRFDFHGIKSSVRSNKFPARTLHFALLNLLLTFGMVFGMAKRARAAETNYVIAIHGGAGVWRKELTPERERQSREAMTTALRAGELVLKTNGISLDAVEAAVRVLEDSPLFNAGKGAVLNSAGKAELDASLMDGATQRAGAVASVHRIKNPISAARMVMEKSPHVLLMGDGAEEFVKGQGMKLVSPGYFITPFRQEQLKRKQQEAKALKSAAVESRNMMGTVGAVALDAHGNLAAATSTGGMVNKSFGRVGDSPIIGAGTYANNATCAVSSTGHGEYFIRAAVAHNVSALMKYKGLKLIDAAEQGLKEAKDLGGTGGLIALDRSGNVAMPFNTEGMFRGVLRGDGTITIAVYPDSPK